MPYVGRFAPSPTGPLHFGSLVAALASWLDAKRAGGRWLLRMEDLDQPRVIPGAADAILRQLEACGLQWDGDVVYQSARLGLYKDAFEKLQAHSYPCACTRKELEDSALAIDGARVYPGTCRAGMAPGKTPRAGSTAFAVRLRTDADPIRFTDRVQGAIAQCVERDVGDFILRRADGIYAYQLAVVVDDDAQGVTDVVRGADLLDSTARQIHLQRLLGIATPRYLHVPVATNATGEKLSKQTHAADARPEDLPKGLRFLGMELAEEVCRVSPSEMLDWASKHWDAGRIPKYRTIVLER